MPDGNEPTGVAFDSAGNLYVSLYQDNIIRRFSPSGADLGVFADTGLANPFGMVFDTAGNLYVSNYDYGRGAAGGWIEKFSPTGADLGAIVSGIQNDFYLAIDASGDLYIDIVPDNVREYSPTGQDLGVFASGFSESYGLAFDQARDLFVADPVGGGGAPIHDELWKFSPSGENLGVFASFGANGPNGVAIDAIGNIYVSLTNSTIEELSPTGVDLGTFATTGTFDPQGLAFGPLPTPTVQVADAGGVYNGSPFPATATVAGVNGTSDSSLEGVTPTLTYYAGAAALAGAPSQAGTYTVVASFAGSADYAAASAQAEFTITPASTTTAVSSAFNPAVAGQVIAFTATVNATTPVNGSPAGAVQFQVDGNDLGSPVAVTAGVATSPGIALTANSHTVTATFIPADASFVGSTGSFTEQVNPVTAANVQQSITQAVQTGNPIVVQVRPLSSTPRPMR